MIRRWRKFTLYLGSSQCALIVAAFVASAFRPLYFGMVDVAGVVLFAGGIYLVGGNSVPGQLLFMDSAGLPSLEHWNAWLIATQPLALAIPLYALFLAVALPTLLVWRFVPKFPRGHCRRCGYNLKGLTEARCPECGTGF